MKRAVAMIAVGLFLLPSLAWAQSEETPQDWVNAARTRHSAIQAARITNPRGGEFAGTTDGLDSSESTTSSSSSSVSSLLSLVSSLTGSSSSSLSGLLGSLTGSTGTSTSTSTSTSGSTTSLADLIALRDSLAASSKQLDSAQTSTTDTTDTTDTTLAYDTRDGSGAIGRLPKFEATSQTSTSDRKFIDRWADSMADSFFTAMAVGFQTSQFQTFLEEQLKAIFFPTTDGTNNTDGNSDGNNNDNTSGGSGIEDQLPPGDNNNSGSDSIV